MDNLPDVIRIEPVGLCNFNCQHCPTGVSPNKRALLSKDKFHEIIDGFKKINFLPRVVVCYHGGEPLLNKNLTYFQKNLISKYFIKSKNILYDNVLSDEGGRFYHSQVKYMACKLDKNQNIQLPDSYIWLSQNQIIDLNY